MNNIPPDLRDEIAMDPFYQDCALSDDGLCEFEEMHRAIEWHHVLINGGRQVQSKAFIVPACSGYHHKYANRSDIAYRFLQIALHRATTEELQGLSKAVDYVRLRDAVGLGDKVGVSPAPAWG